MTKPTTEELRRRVEDIQNLRKSESIKILITEMIPIIYVPSRCGANILVASGKNLIYVECGSQHGNLNLLNVTEPPKNGRTPIYEDSAACYDRDPVTRQITAIYLYRTDVIKFAFSGTLDDLMRHPNVAKRD